MADATPTPTSDCPQAPSLAWWSSTSTSTASLRLRSVRACPCRGSGGWLGLAGPHPLRWPSRLLPEPGTSEQRSWQAPRAHVDFRGDGGYVIAPPSRIAIARRAHGLRRHRHRGQETPHSIDSVKLRQFLEPPRRLPPRIDVPTIGARPDKLAAWVASRPEGGRNAGLFWAACRMAEQGHDVQQTAAVLGDAARTAGLEDREVDTTIQSAYRIATRMSGTPTVSRPGPTRPAEVLER